ncbi:hypothetical protein JVU11DRAFT_6256 [Chiua virens]|nr:hypothetical protein JVU11DRAFT_6256 [Chiua virens]
MACEWCHLKQLQRSDHGHDPSGTASTQGGELCVLCPACLQSGKNLSDGWDKVPDDKQ